MAWRKLLGTRPAHPWDDACICHPGVRHLERQQTGMFQSYKLESLGVSILQTWKLGGLLKTLCEGSHNYSVCTMVQREDTECRLHHRRVQNACEGFCFSLFS